MVRSEVERETGIPPGETIQPPEEPVDRRGFIKGTAAAGTALVAGGVAAATATSQEKAVDTAKSHQVMSARFDTKRPPKLEDVHAVLNAMLRRGGCPTCGLGGIDVRLFAADPVQQVQKPENVKVPVEITAGR